MTPDKFAHLRLPRLALPADVFIGGTGEVVLIQERSEPDGETYYRIFVRPDEVETLIGKLQSIRSELHHRGAA
jgi:hypothetical protein